MPLEYLWGVLTIPALLLIACVVWFAFSAATWAWEHLHKQLIEQIKIGVNPYRSETRREKAQSLVDDLVQAPHFWMFPAFGWAVVIVREYKLPKETP